MWANTAKGRPIGPGFGDFSGLRLWAYLGFRAWACFAAGIASLGPRILKVSELRGASDLVLLGIVQPRRLLYA